jgi:hypothetical protein
VTRSCEQGDSPSPPLPPAHGISIFVFRYDLNGKGGVEEAPKMDSSALYAMIFGSEKFEPLVGELQLASQMQSETGSDKVPVELSPYPYMK